MGIMQPPAEAGTRSHALPALNQDQEAALAAAQDALFSRRQPFLLEGLAGAGKTRLIVELVRRWPGRVAVCAPTHKAAGVLHQMLLLDPTIDVAAGFAGGATRREALDDAIFNALPAEIELYEDDNDSDEDLARVAVGTIHSLLGLQPLEDDQGAQRLVPITESAAGQFSLVVIDECSMIGEALQNAIDARTAGVPVLYAGDWAQLPPVGEDEAPCLGLVQQRAELNEIVRQQQGNPILQAASALHDQQQMVRQDIDIAWALDLPAWQPGQPGIFEATLDDILTAFRADPDYCRMLAYTNGATITHNTRIREAVIGRTPTRFLPGERCLVRTPVITLSKWGDASILIPVNAEPEVLTIRAEILSIPVGGPLWKGRGREWPAQTLRAPVWRLDLSHNGARIAGAIERAAGMRANWLDHATRTRRWDDRWRVRAALNDLRHVYAATVHTAQGSTYDTVFIDMHNLLLGGRANRLTRLALLYTACTRARLQLGLYWENQGLI